VRFYHGTLKKRTNVGRSLFQQPLIKTPIGAERRFAKIRILTTRCNGRSIGVIRAISRNLLLKTITDFHLVARKNRACLWYGFFLLLRSILQKVVMGFMEFHKIQSQKQN
jgi:hypothetical protein